MLLKREKTVDPLVKDTQWHSTVSIPTIVNIGYMIDDAVTIEVDVWFSF